MSHILLKPMQTDDEIMGKAYVHHQAWQETYTGLIDAEYLKAFTRETCERIAYKSPHNIIVAKDGDRVIGFAGYGAYRDGTLPGVGEVYSIYVLAAYHGQGVGYALMNAAFERLTDYPQVAVWVLKGNNRAIRFYERYGFRFDGMEQEILLGTPNTELRMICNKG